MELYDLPVTPALAKELAQCSDKLLTILSHFFLPLVSETSGLANSGLAACSGVR